VAFEDFQCPFCKKVNDTVQRVVDRYKDQVKLVHHDFPLQPLHPAAWKAHEAARCAADQGKFWQFRDLLYKNAPAASLEDLKGYASGLGLNMDHFTSCLGSGKFTAAVQRDEEEGERVGVQGTPAFFVNGRLLSGAQPESEFARLIDDELNKRTLR
jgi:protein-disulfide isomerase